MAVHQFRVPKTPRVHDRRVRLLLFRFDLSLGKLGGRRPVGLAARTSQRTCQDRGGLGLDGSARFACGPVTLAHCSENNSGRPCANRARL